MNLYFSTVPVAQMSSAPGGTTVAVLSLFVVVARLNADRLGPVDCLDAARFSRACVSGLDDDDDDEDDDPLELGRNCLALKTA